MVIIILRFLSNDICFPTSTSGVVYRFNFLVVHIVLVSVPYAYAMVL
jgi:hypothetical protein